ncbi:MAG: CHAT domain-containing protein, partial [Actinomycetota bacterium]|nr:CHAT domain-containing protein [Actinomycetota bacterium]
RDLTTVRRAAVLLQALGMPSSAVEAHLTTGRVAMALGRPAAALDSFDKAQDLARRGPVLLRVKGRVAAALAAQLKHDDRSLLRQCRLGLTDLERHRGALASMELRALASRHGADLGRLGLAVLRRTAPATRVLEWMERTRAAAISAVEPPTTAGIEQDLAALRAVHAEQEQVRRETGREAANLAAKQTVIESRIRRITWARQASADVRSTAVSKAGPLRALLDGQVLVEYGVLGGRLFAVVLEPRRTRLVQLGTLEAVRYEADALLFALRRLARPRSSAALAAARASADAALQRLTALLMRPLAVPDDVGLVIVPLGELQHIPWSALHRAPLSLAPSASLWARTRRRAVRAERGTVLVAGPGLPGAEAEIEALRRRHDQPTVLVPPASTVGAVAAALDHAEFAHLACHARLRVDNPIFSTLVLSDGPLTVHELDLRGVAPRRLVLAACDSGADVSYAENEMLGFVSALFARGAGGLIASVVTVPDLDAVRLMCLLHEHLRGGATLADALHAARELLDRDNPGEFVNWCGFNAFGAA